MEKCYAISMKQFIASIFPKTIFRQRMQYVAVGVACLTIVVMIFQLFAFEKLPDTLEALQLGVPVLVAIAIVAIELGSLPFLLSMPLRASLRRVSAMLSLAVPIMWLELSVWLLVRGQEVNTGVLGSKYAMQPLATMIVALVWLVLVALCLWRMLESHEFRHKHSFVKVV